VARMGRVASDESGQHQQSQEVTLPSASQSFIKSRRNAQAVCVFEGGIHLLCCLCSGSRLSRLTKACVWKLSHAQDTWADRYPVRSSRNYAILRAFLGWFPSCPSAGAGKLFPRRSTARGARLNPLDGRFPDGSPSFAE